MPSTFEPSFHDKLAQAQYEDLLKARVVNQAKAVYHEDQFRDCTFHHVENGNIIASLIAYPVANNNLHAPWIPLLDSLGSNTESVYKSLNDALRVKVNTVLTSVPACYLEDAEELLNQC
ncbi:hypothetical protein AG0111_0g10559 [Alternaria gaisen]|uniref:Uncharacterized protein n=1 Tax=Alternaria gaisen TaxID=167740 RepID=A0ACB6F9T1_9PLEO|nr:hypothetical protein AG0111_0g10559 [Alternaria gaisen]